MTEEQKRFKIQKRTRFEEQVSQESKKVVRETFLLGLTVAGALYDFAISNNADDLVLLFLGVANTGVSVWSLKSLMEAISRKTMLQGKIEDINTELEMPENEESKGMRK